jgi:hypothetical protein
MYKIQMIQMIGIRTKSSFQTRDFSWRRYSSSLNGVWSSMPGGLGTEVLNSTSSLVGMLLTDMSANTRKKMMRNQ